jgi:hypothetical protein
MMRSPRASRPTNPDLCERHLDDQFIKRVLQATPSWLIDLVGDGDVYATPRWKRRLAITTALNLLHVEMLQRDL